MRMDATRVRRCRAILSRFFCPGPPPLARLRVFISASTPCHSYGKLSSHCTMREMPCSRRAERHAPNIATDKLAMGTSQRRGWCALEVSTSSSHCAADSASGGRMASASNRARQRHARSTGTRSHAARDSAGVTDSPFRGNQSIAGPKVKGQCRRNRRTPAVWHHKPYSSQARARDPPLASWAFSGR